MSLSKSLNACSSEINDNLMSVFPEVGTLVVDLREEFEI